MATEQLFGSYMFLLEISGITPNEKTLVGGFKSMEGLDSETEVIEFKQGNDMVIRQKPGRTKYSPIVLERGFTASDDLWKWRKNIEDGIIDRRSGTVTVLDQDGETIVAQYNFYEAWVSKWEAPKMNSESSEMALERITIHVEKTERVAVGK